MQAFLLLDRCTRGRFLPCCIILYQKAFWCWTSSHIECYHQSHVAVESGSKRSWHEYNQKLVNETLETCSFRETFLESFKKLHISNEGKVGRPFQYASSVILMI